MEERGNGNGQAGVTRRGRFLIKAKSVRDKLTVFAWESFDELVDFPSSSRPNVPQALGYFCYALAFVASWYLASKVYQLDPVQSSMTIPINGKHRFPDLIVCPTAYSGRHIGSMDSSFSRPNTFDTVHRMFRKIYLGLAQMRNPSASIVGWITVYEKVKKSCTALGIRSSPCPIEKEPLCNGTTPTEGVIFSGRGRKEILCGKYKTIGELWRNMTKNWSGNLENRMTKNHPLFANLIPYTTSHVGCDQVEIDGAPDYEILAKCQTDENVEILWVDKALCWVRRGEEMGFRNFDSFTRGYLQDYDIKVWVGNLQTTEVRMEDFFYVSQDKGLQYTAVSISHANPVPCPAQVLINGYNLPCETGTVLQPGKPYWYYKVEIGLGQNKRQIMKKGVKVITESRVFTTYVRVTLMIGMFGTLIGVSALQIVETAKYCVMRCLSSQNFRAKKVLTIIQIAIGLGLTITSLVMFQIDFSNYIAGRFTFEYGRISTLVPQLPTVAYCDYSNRERFFTRFRRPWLSGGFFNFAKLNNTEISDNLKALIIMAVWNEIPQLKNLDNLIINKRGNYPNRPHIKTHPLIESYEERLVDTVWVDGGWKCVPLARTMVRGLIPKPIIGKKKVKDKKGWRWENYVKDYEYWNLFTFESSLDSFNLTDEEFNTDVFNGYKTLDESLRPGVKEYTQRFNLMGENQFLYFQKFFEILEQLENPLAKSTFFNRCSKLGNFSAVFERALDDLKNLIASTGMTVQNGGVPFHEIFKQFTLNPKEIIKECFVGGEKVQDCWQYARFTHLDYYSAGRQCILLEFPGTLLENTQYQRGKGGNNGVLSVKFNSAILPENPDNPEVVFRPEKKSVFDFRAGYQRRWDKHLKRRGKREVKWRRLKHAGRRLVCVPYAPVASSRIYDNGMYTKCVTDTEPGDIIRGYRSVTGSGQSGFHILYPDRSTSSVFAPSARESVKISLGETYQTQISKQDEPCLQKEEQLQNSIGYCRFPQFDLITLLRAVQMKIALGCVDCREKPTNGLAFDQQIYTEALGETPPCCSLDAWIAKYKSLHEELKWVQEKDEDYLKTGKYIHSEYRKFHDILSDKDYNMSSLSVRDVKLMETAKKFRFGPGNYSESGALKALEEERLFRHLKWLDVGALKKADVKFLQERISGIKKLDNATVGQLLAYMRNCFQAKMCNTRKWHFTSIQREEVGKKPDSGEFSIVVDFTAGATEGNTEIDQLNPLSFILVASAGIAAVFGVSFISTVELAMAKLASYKGFMFIRRKNMVLRSLTGLLAPRKNLYVEEKEGNGQNQKEDRRFQKPQDQPTGMDIARETEEENARTNETSVANWWAKRVNTSKMMAPNLFVGFMLTVAGLIYFILDTDNKTYLQEMKTLDTIIPPSIAICTEKSQFDNLTQELDNLNCTDGYKIPLKEEPCSALFTKKLIGLGGMKNCLIKDVEREQRKVSKTDLILNGTLSMEISGGFVNFPEINRNNLNEIERFLVPMGKSFTGKIQYTTEMFSIGISSMCQENWPSNNCQLCKDEKEKSTPYLCCLNKGEKMPMMIPENEFKPLCTSYLHETQLPLSYSLLERHIRSRSRGDPIDIYGYGNARKSNPERELRLKGIEFRQIAAGGLVYSSHIDVKFSPYEYFSVLGGIVGVFTGVTVINVVCGVIYPLAMAMRPVKTSTISA